MLMHLLAIFLSMHPHVPIEIIVIEEVVTSEATNYVGIGSMAIHTTSTEGQL
jgi:hypothetical protein